VTPRRVGDAKRRIPPVEIEERDWLMAGFLWAGLALLSALPWVGASWLGQAARVLICLTALVHVGEAFYAMRLARRADLDPLRWAIRSLMLGYFSVRRLHQLV
jgi:Transmembrane protein 254